MRALGHFRRRLLHGAFLLFSVSLLSFVFAELAPGDFFAEMRLHPGISLETVTRLRSQYGIDQPLPIRFAKWCVSALQGEFGFSFAYNSPAGPLLWARAKNTLLLTTTATLMAWLAAIPLGVWSAVRFGKWDEHICTAGTTALQCLPDVLLALGFMLLAVQTGWFPPGGMVSVDFVELSTWGRFKDLAWHLVVPVTVLGLSMVPVLVRHVRSGVLEVLRAPFVVAARAHGIGRTRILVRHVLPASLNPLISLLGLTIGNLLGASFLVEVVMGWPGLGPLFLDAIFARDMYLVIGAVFFSAACFIVGNLVADVLLVAADPRIRSQR